MDPLAVLKTLWHYKVVVIPLLAVTLTAAVYVFEFAPRTFEATASYAVINPSIPTSEELLRNPDLRNLNSNNPYLRSADASLIVQVAMTKLNDKSSSDVLESQGLSTDYAVSRGYGGSGFMLDVSGRGHTAADAFATARALGDLLQKDLYDTQKVYGADDRFLFTSIVVAPATKATEQFSSRLRSVIVVLLGGMVLIVGAVSIARSLSITRGRFKTARSDVTGRGEGITSDSTSAYSTTPRKLLGPRAKVDSTPPSTEPTVIEDTSTPKASPA